MATRDPDQTVDFIGWNLIGNPFTCNAYLSSGRDFYRMNAAGDAIVLATDENGGNVIKPCEGIFVVVGADDPETYLPFPGMPTQLAQIQFTTTEPEPSGSKGLLDIKVKQEGQLADVARVRFGEGDRTDKIVLSDNATLLSIRLDGKDYSVVHNEAHGEMPLSFKANKDGQYTLVVNPEGVEVDYLHLIDNMTGNDIDLLAGASTGSAIYTFTAKTTDYESRFKLVFSTNETDGPSTSSGTFAFVNNGEIVVNGKGMLQVIDMTGHIIISRDAACHISTNGMTPGVYVLRLINGANVKTQTIVIE